MKKLLYTLLVGAIALSSCGKSETPTPAPTPGEKPDGGGKVETVYKVGDIYPDTKLPIGVVFWVDETDKSYDATAKTSAKGKIVGLVGVERIWSSEIELTGATSETDGAANTAKVLALGSYTTGRYPAFAWCAAKNTPAVEGIHWYLPAILELKDGIYANRVILNNTLASIAGALPFWEYHYWSSTDIDGGGQAKFMYFSTGEVLTVGKMSDGKIGFRAVSAF